MIRRTLQPTLSKLSRGITSVIASFKPSALFKAGEQGVWYDPSDFERYMGEKGPELVTGNNSTFDTGVGAWANTSGNATLAAVGGALRVTQTAVNGRASLVLTGVTAGKMYELTGRMRVVSGAATVHLTFSQYADGNGAYGSVSSASTSTTFVNALARITATSNEIYLSAGANGDGTSVFEFDNISVRELTAISTATLFQDAAGTTPVTVVEQPVGLMLDKRLGLLRGDERLVNGDFTNGTTGWVSSNTDATHITTFVGGKMRYQSDTTTPVLQVQQNGVQEVGKWYEIITVASAWVSGSIKSDSMGGVVLASGVGTFVARAQAVATTSFTITRNTTNVDITIDSISIKELPGNHAFQSTAASRPVLSARMNLLQMTEGFHDIYWGRTLAGSVAANVAVAPDGTLTADKFLAVNSLNQQWLYRSSIGSSPGAPATFSCYFKAGEMRYAQLRLITDSNSIVGMMGLDLQTGLTYGAAVGTVSVQPVGNGWYRCAVTGTIATTANVYINLNQNPILTENYTGDGVSGIYVWGAQLELGPTVTRYQRVNTATDYDTVGFPHYLKFDGVDDNLVTGNIDFTSTDKMTVWAGVRKLNDTTAGFLCGFGNPATGNGSWAVHASPNNNLARFGFDTRGTVGRMFIANAGPYTLGTNKSYIISCKFNNAAAPISSNAVLPRIDGLIVPMTNDGLPETGVGGMYGNSVFILGRVTPTTGGYFNGQLYGLIARGAATDDVTPAERYLANKTGVTL